MVSPSSRAENVQLQYLTDSNVTTAVGHSLSHTTCPVTEPPSTSLAAACTFERILVKLPSIRSSPVSDRIAVISAAPLPKTKMPCQVPVTEVDGPNRPPSSHPIVPETASRIISPTGDQKRLSPTARLFIETPATHLQPSVSPEYTSPFRTAAIHCVLGYWPTSAAN